jgi:hypothetical protein
VLVSATAAADPHTGMKVAAPRARWVTIEALALA